MNFRVIANCKREWKILHGCNCKMINGAAYHRHIVQTQMKQWKIELHIVSTTRDTLQRDQKVNRALREVYKLSLFVIKV